VAWPLVACMVMTRRAASGAGGVRKRPVALDYVRDDQPWMVAAHRPPIFRFSSGSRGNNPNKHLAGWQRRAAGDAFMAVQRSLSR